MELGYVQVVVGIIVLVVIGPVAQLVTLRVGFNGMREDVREIKMSMSKIAESDADQNTSLAVHDQRIVSLESRIKKVEADV